MRSPYPVSLVEFVERFGTTGPRCVLLSGLLAFRHELHSAGLVNGFQWMDGSFVENKELIEGSQPKDIDCVTFYDLPVEDDEYVYSNFSKTFDRKRVKEQLGVDSVVVLNLRMPTMNLVRATTHYYSLFSHQRNREWKGFVQVKLSPEDDVAASAALAAIINEPELDSHDDE